MKALTKYAALALVAGLWSCTSTRTAQQPGEYDDLYFSSKDREQELVASTSASALKYDQMNRENDTYSQQNANPDYVESSSNGRRDNNRNGDAYNAGDTYYDDNYITDRRKFGSIRPSVTTGFGGGYAYTSPAYYDPFFSPYGYDPFYAQNAYSSFYYDPFFSYRPYWGFRPGVSINLSFNSWGRPWGWHDPFWGARPWGGYNAWNSWGGWGGYGYDPFWGGGNMFYSPVYNNYYGYGGGWNRPGFGGNTVIVGNGGRDNNTIYRNYGQRGSRGSELTTDQNNGSSPRGSANGGGRSGRVDQAGSVNTNPDAGNAPGRSTRPARVSTPDSYRPQRNPDDYSRGGRPNANPDVITTRPAPAESNAPQYSTRPSRAVRPQGSDYSNDNGGRQRSSTYYENNNSNSNNSRPTYSAPRNDSWSGGSNNNSGSYSRPSRSNDGGGSYNSNPGGRSGGYSGGGSRSGGSTGGGNTGGGGGGRVPRGQ